MRDLEAVLAVNANDAEKFVYPKNNDRTWFGIGVDHGIFLYAKLLTALEADEYFEDAMYLAFTQTGSAVVLTGLTLAVGVSMWLFSDLKFQADMGVLLTFMFIVNMLGAIIVLPALARWLFCHHTRTG